MLPRAAFQDTGPGPFLSHAGVLGRGNCGQPKNGPPKDVHILTPRAYSCPLYGKTGLADVILRWELILDDLDGPKVVTNVLIKRKQEIRVGIGGM